MDVGSGGQVTVVVTCRERYSLAAASLDSLYEHAEHPFDLIYVDAIAPRQVARMLRAQAARRGFTLVRVDRFVPPNHARAIALDHLPTATASVVFVDNDVLAEPGWLRELVACAEETGAAVVGPLYLEGPPTARRIHMAGGKLTIREQDGRRLVHEEHVGAGKADRTTEIATQRHRCDYVEMHCMLIQRETLRRIGPLDPELMSSREHLDVCLGVAAIGGEVWLEPAAVVTYDDDSGHTLRDLPFYLRRWSEQRNHHSMRRFEAKWGLEQVRPDGSRYDPNLRRSVRLFGGPFRRLGRRPPRWLIRAATRTIIPLERAVNRLVFRDPSGPPVVRRIR